MDSQEPKFELRRLSDKSDAALISEIQRVAAQISGPITRDAFAKFAKVNPSTVERRFGSWEAVLGAAGLQDRAHPSASKLTASEITLELRRIAAKLGKSTLTIEDVERHSRVTAGRIRRTWGTAKNAFVAAGLASTPLGRRYDDEERFENLLAVWTHYGRPPKYREMHLPPSAVGGKAYTLRHGSWIGALEAFVERVNGPEPSQTASQPTVVSEAKPAPELGPRDAPLALRFKVFQRDRFRCVLCGTNPPIDPLCVLHIDHIQPWSLGGATTLENLRTLCANCNVGRSNRYTNDDKPAKA